MPLDILTTGEALVEIMRTDIDQPLDAPEPITDLCVLNVIA